MIFFAYWLVAFFSLLLFSNRPFESGAVTLGIFIVAPVLFPAVLINRLFK